MTSSALPLSAHGLASRTNQIGGEEYKFSTTLRQSIPADSVLPSSFIPGSSGSGNPYNSSSAHPKRQSTHDAFAHTAHTATPSARYARMTGPQVLLDLNSSDSTGLHSHVVAAIRTLSGPNDFAVGAQENVYLKFAKQFYESPLNLLLLGSAAVSALVGNLDDAISISLAIVIVVTVGFVQEQRSEKSLEALNRLVPHYCHVLRDGAMRTELANILVPGDIVTFSTGDRVPADVRLLTAADLEIDESSLTGETHPARKTTDAIPTSATAASNSARAASPAVGHHEILGIAERTNTGFMGTLVKSGRGTGVVVATGDSTEFGVIFSMMQDVEDRKTPLQVSMDELATKLSAASFVIIGFICLIGVWQQRSWLEMFTIGVSLAVAAIPEGLPIVVTVTLALGVLRMSRRKAIVKKLPSVETLGSVSVICSDKTGTLTTNEMTTIRLFTVDRDLIDITQGGLAGAELSQATRRVLLIGNLCNHTFRNSEGVYVGSSTEIAAINTALNLTGADERERFTKTNETPFNSEQKWQSVTGRHPLISSGDRDVTFYMGATEAILSACSFYVREDGATAAMDHSLASLIGKKATDLSANMGTRILATAYKLVDNTFASSKASNLSAGAASLPSSGLVFAGFQAMLDPPRRGVDQAISTLNNAGVQVVMITGDSEATARSIASQLGIRVNPRTPDPSKTHFASASASDVMTGSEIDTLSQRQLTERIANVSVFARTTPRHKMAIIEAFQSRGKIVAMTGDGVNDAPALKLADIGISMGKGGTDVAKEAADMILVDDNFSTIIPAVEEGKCIFYNIQNFLCFQLSTAVAALSLVTLSTALQLPNPLNAMQILFINILMDGPPSQSLGVDPVDRGVMQRPPRPKNQPVLNQQLLMRIGFSALMVVLGTLFIYAHELSDGSMTGRDQTMTFTGFVFLDLVSAIQNRGLNCGIKDNRMLLLTCSISFSAQLLMIYFPPLQAVFQTEALSFRDLSVLLMLAGASAAAHGFRRSYERKLSSSRFRWEDEAV